MITNLAGDATVHLPAVVGQEEVPIAVLAAATEAPRRPQGDLRRQSTPPRAGRDDNVKLVTPPRWDAGQPEQRLQLIELRAVVLLHFGGNQLPRVLAQLVALAEHPELPLEDGPVE